MTEEVKTELVKPELVKLEQDKENSPEKKEEKKKLSQSIFVTENDTFDVKVKFYREGARLFVDEVDEEFDKSKTCEEINVKFKYASQGDSDLIVTQANLNGKVDEIDVREFTRLGLIRLMILSRDWDIDEKLNNESIMKLHPKIVKALLNGIVEEIGMDGII